jgi:parvulin-like peptidyl-prolyl isomerase
MFLMVFALANFPFVFGQGGKKMEALKKINSVAQAEEYINRHGSTSARIGNFSRLIDSTEYKEIEANYKVGDVVFYKKYTIKILGGATEPLFRCQYIVLDGNKMNKAKIDSLRNEITTKFNAGIPFKSLANLYSMDVKTNDGDSGWFHKSRMGEAFCKDLLYKKIGDLFLFDNVEKKKYYIVLKTHAELYADSWVFVAM